MKTKHCVACAAIEGLEHHHLKPKFDGGGDEETNLITLCSACHGIIHGMVRKPIGEAIRRGIYNIDPELFDEKFSALWEEIKPHTYKKFCIHLNTIGFLHPTGEPVWSKMMVQHYAGRLKLKTGAYHKQQRFKKSNPVIKKEKRIIAKSLLSNKTLRRYASKVADYIEWAEGIDNPTENREAIVKYVTSKKVTGKRLDFLISGISYYNKLHMKGKISLFPEIKELKKLIY